MSDIDYWFYFRTGPLSPFYTYEGGDKLPQLCLLPDGMDVKDYLHEALNIAGIDLGQNEARGSYIYNTWLSELQDWSVITDQDGREWVLLLPDRDSKLTDPNRYIVLFPRVVHADGLDLIFNDKMGTVSMMTDDARAFAVNTLLALVQGIHINELTRVTDGKRLKDNIYKGTITLNGLENAELHFLRLEPRGFPVYLEVGAFLWEIAVLAPTHGSVSYISSLPPLSS